MGLYQSLLGNDFAKLGEGLRRFHEEGGSAKGALNVTHAKHPIPRFFVWLMRLPKAGMALETSLEVTETTKGELWDRSIGKTRLVTKQRAARGKLIEEAGPLSFEFDLGQTGDAMVFHSYRSTLLGIPIPKHIAPHIDATAEPDGKGWKVNVNIQCPRFGTICRYEGRIEPV